MIKRIISFVLFLCALILSILGTSEFLENKYSREKYDPFFKNYKYTNYDVIWMGTSHTYNTVLAQEIWHDSNITSYNFGSANCTIPVDYYVLKQLCNYTKPKLVVIDLYGLIEYENSGNGKYQKDSVDQYRVQFDSMPLSKTKIEAVNDIFDDRESNFDFLFNFAIYHSRWKDIGKDNFSPRDIPQNGSAFVLGKGGCEYTEPNSGEQIEINTICSSYIPKIVDFCEKNDIEVMFVYLPFTANDTEVSVAFSFENFIKSYPSCKYVNMLNKGILDYRTDLYVDNSHLNYLGGAKVTKWLGNYLANNYPELVHNDKATCDFWDKEYDKYVDYKITRFDDDNFYNNLLLLYGDDFYAKLYVTNELVDDDTKYLINELNINISKVQNIVYDNKEYLVKLEVYRANTNDIVYQGYYNL